MQIERIEEMRLTPPDEAQIGALLDASFGGEYDGRSYFQQRPNVRLVWRQTGRIAGHVAIWMRAIRVGSTIVNVAGLGDVATDPACRGSGVATKLVAAAIADARESLGQFVVLFGDGPLYSAAGFVAKPNAVRGVHLTGAATGGLFEGQNDGLMVLPLSDLIWDDIAVVDLVGHDF